MGNSVAKYKRVGVTVKSGFTEKNEAVSQVLSILRDEGCTILFDPKRIEDTECAKDLEPFSHEDDIDLLLVIGGDGTILRSIREMQNFTTPVLSVNRGRVGFLAETNIEEVDELLPKFLRGEGAIDTRSLVSVRVLRSDKELFSGFALNEAVIAQGVIARIVDLNTRVNGEPLTKFHADGLIVSTPTGSTAYSLAAGGPIVHPGLGAVILTPINPHSFSQKPIVVPGKSTTEVEVCTRARKFEDFEVVLTLDGQVSVQLQRGDIVQLVMGEKTISFLRRNEDTFFHTLREKLKWGERVD